jgi:hypothetical protein
MKIDPDQFALSVNRRTFLTNSAYGIGGLAFASLLARAGGAIPAAGADGKWRGVIAPRIFRSKQSESFIFAWQADRRSSKALIPNRSSPNFTNTFPEATPKDSSSQLQGSKLEAMGPFAEFKNTVSGAEIPTFSKIGSVADDSASSVRCSPSRSITIRHTPS